MFFLKGSSSRAGCSAAGWCFSRRLSMSLGGVVRENPESSTVPISDLMNVVAESGPLPDCLKVPSWDTLHPNPCVRRFILTEASTSPVASENPEAAGKSRSDCPRSALIMTEVMAECRAGVIVPQKYIESEIARLSALRALMIFSASKDDNRVGSDVLSQLEIFNGRLVDELDRIITVLTDNINFLARRQSSEFFKRSVDKGRMEASFMPTNLHQQCLLVHGKSESGSPRRFDVTTVGAFTAQFFMEGGRGLAALQPARSLDESNPDVTIVHTGRPKLPGSTALTVLKQAALLAQDLERIDTLLDAQSPSSSAQSRVHQHDLGQGLAELMDAVSGRLSVLEGSRRIQGRLDQLARNFTTELRSQLPLLLSSSLKDIDLSSCCDLYLREQIVVSQLVSATTSAVMTALYTLPGFLANSDFAERLTCSNFGVIVYFESLLSCWDDEEVMLEDIIGGMEVLSRFRFRVPLLTAAKDLSSGDFTIVCSEDEIGLPPASSDLLGETLREGLLISIFPVFLNVGINEKATTAEREPDLIKLQRENNACHGRRLIDYAERVNAKNKDCEPVLTNLVEAFKNALTSTLPKNTELLRRAEDLTRCLGGLRLTMCKSAKDRTAMAVTLEEVSLVQKHTNIDTQLFDKLLTETRRSGTRRENTVKNIGFPKYAFAKDQFEHLPAIYQPPSGTYGKAAT